MATDPVVPFQFLAIGSAESPKVQADFESLLKYIRDRNNGTVQWDYVYALTAISQNNLLPDAPLHIGSVADSFSTNSTILAGRAYATGASNAHSYEDVSTFSGNAGVAFCSYDTRATTTGANNYDHLIAFQSGIKHGSSGTLGKLYDFGASGINNGGTITNRYGFYVVEGSGAGAITNQYGLYVESLIKGATLNYSVFTAGTTPSLFGGQVFGPAGSTTAPSFSTSGDPNTGVYFNAADILGFVAGGAAKLFVFGTGTSATVLNADLLSNGDATFNIGGASNYVNDVSYKTLTDRGCIPWCDDGVEMPDGKIVSDLEAICSIQKHPTNLTVHDLPRLDYSTFPKKAIRKAEEDKNFSHRDIDGTPWCNGPKGEGKMDILKAEDGVEMTMVFGVMIGAFKEINERLVALEA